MKYQITGGSTSVILTVFILDSSNTTGAGLAGLDQTSGIVGGYVRMNSVGVALSVNEDVTTEGTYQAPSTVAQVRIGTPANMRPGTYELHFHDDLWATGTRAVTITLGGATNMADLPLEVQLIGMDFNDVAKASVCSEARLAELDAANLPADVAAAIADIATVDGKVTALPSLADILTTAMTESYAANGVVPSLAQILFEARALLATMARSGVAVTTYKVDGTTPAATYVFDDAADPSRLTRAT